MKLWLREPLLHFLVLGVALFALHRVIAPRPPGRTIAVTPEVAEGLARDHERRTRAAPSADERRALIDRYVESELLYREALALGLDRGDTIVRRRLVQKMQFVLETAGDGEQPGDDELRALIARAPERWAQPTRLSFTHVFVPSGDAAPLRARLLRGE